MHNYEERASTLTRKRTEGGGPKYIWNGKRALYDPHDLDAYIADRYAATFEEAEKRLDREAAHG